MTNAKSMMSAIISSVIALLICFAMLVGTSFAWFTDSVTSGNNLIKAGTLKVDLELLEKDGSWTSIKDSGKAIFDYDLWESGYTDVKILKVENEGTLALKWVTKFVSEYELTELADVIDVYVLRSDTPLTYPTNPNLDGYENVGTVAKFVNTIEDTANGELAPGKVEYLSIALKIKAEAGNAYQGLDLGGAFEIIILAAQSAYEEDAFGNDYDKDAEYDYNNVYVGNVKYESIAAAVAAANDGDTIRLTAGTFYEAINLQGKSLTIQGASKASTIIAGPKDYTTTNIPMQSWEGWSGQDANVYALISANKDVTIKDLTVSGNPTQIAEVAQFRHESNCAFVGIHVQSANATIENVNIRNIKPVTVDGTDHHNFGLYITTKVGDTNSYTATYKNGMVSDVNRGAIYCWSTNYTLGFENITVIGPGSPSNSNGTLAPAAGSESNNAIYAFAPFYTYSNATYKDVTILDAWCVEWWGGASWAWADPAWATNPPQGVTCINCGWV